jgi:hypothetical protein
MNNNKKKKKYNIKFIIHRTVNSQIKIHSQLFVIVINILKTSHIQTIQTKLLMCVSFKNY